MIPQSSSRKRAAPGAVPIPHQQSPQTHNYPTSDTHLSNDQFMQWGQANAALSNSAGNVNVDSFQSATHPGVDTSVLQAPNQLARRAASQLINRPRSNEPSLIPLMEQSVATPQDDVDPATGVTEEQLERRALSAKKDAQAKRKQIPPFIQKLSSFLDESKNTDLIRWSEDGRSFIVLDEDQFARTLIPELFKHSNYASFVRQLNMYGFHKKVGLSDNSMRASERKNKSPSEYSNPYFRRGHPDLLWLIQKPKNISQSKNGKGGSRPKAEGDEDIETEDYVEDGGGSAREDRSKFRGQLSITPGEATLAKDQFNNLYRELQNIRHQQQIISTTISKLRREHEQLYDQAINFQEQHNRHENSINAILTFLATVYNRSLQGHDGPQGLINSFAGAMPQDPNQGNIIDVGDFIGNVEPNVNSAQRPLKKQPLLLKAPPAASGESPGRANTLSPSANNQYNVQPNKNDSQHHRAASAQSGSVEELFESTSPQTTNQPQQQYTPMSHSRNQSQSSTRYPPQRDIMSLIQNSNARNSIQPGMPDFPTVLSSLENSGGNAPLTASQRADMLRLIANESHASDPSTLSSSNNALITPTPPPMPLNYPSQLADTRAHIDHLVKMQAEQDRSVQNLTNMLQPLSPTGLIPGLEPDNPSNVPPPALDLDQIFNSGDYFTEYAGLGTNNNTDGSTSMYGTNLGVQEHAPSVHSNAGSDAALEPHPNDLFDFNKLHSDPVGDLFSDVNTDSKQPASFYDEYGNPQREAVGGDNVSGQGRNRITESFTSSGATSPATTSIDENLQSLDNYNGTSGRVKRRKGC
ncbi:Heat shock transcription factor [Ophidiomyces ophidiicola]|nr:Heat shock transcription factor [Ophidiomyces ophidiicola]